MNERHEWTVKFEAVHSAELSGVLRIRHSLQQIPQPALNMMTRNAAAQDWLKKHFQMSGSNMNWHQSGRSLQL